MNVAIIGSGGREHALALKISESDLLEKLYILPGNPGTAQFGENINLDVKNHSKIVELCKEIKIDLVVIGPEQPLVGGLGDVLRKNNILVFGPDAKAAEIEAQKSFAKYIMKSVGVPTANYLTFNTSMYERAKDYIKQKKYPCVIKADGLAAGKGVVICNSSEEALEALHSFFIDKKFGISGERILIEEFLTGEEASVFAITDGINFVCLPPSQDYKRIGENDTGKNTGGMGAYAPAPMVTDEILEKVSAKIIEPVLRALNTEGRKFVGCLYTGLILTDEGPKVIEFNCRFGDPEAQVVLPLLKGDFLKLLHSAANGNLDKDAIRYETGSAVCVVAASRGYPESYQVGFEINGLGNIPQNVIVFHAGTKDIAGRVITDGGRVLGVTSVIPENDFSAAKTLAYKALANIHFDNIYYRKDISNKAIKT